MSKKEEILKSLEPLFQEAKNKGFWFYSSYQSIWFSPKELQSEHESGTFIWGAVNWQLRDPKDHIKELKLESISIQKEILDFEERLIEGSLFSNTTVSKMEIDERAKSALSEIEKEIIDMSNEKYDRLSGLRDAISTIKKHFGLKD